MRATKLNVVKCFPWSFHGVETCYFVKQTNNNQLCGKILIKTL